MKKKNALLGITLACMLSMTACGNKVEDYSDKKKTTEAVTEATTEASTEAKTEEPATSDMNSPFYGVWVYGSKDKADADNFAANVNGMTSLVFLTTDWSNLNTEPYYVVSLGMYTTEDDANGALETAKDLGYSDAYVKYSGEHN
jgi:septal ring-binding cell division protein DamX